jgi:tetratricopeptide (TPR) repeat protein
MKKIFFLSICLIISSCKKQQNINLAKNLYEQSIVEAEDGNLKNALQIINKSIEMKPSLNSYALKATILYQLKEYQESLPIFQKIISNKKFSATLKTDVMNNYACTLLALNKKEQAKIIWNELVTDKHYLSPEVALFNLGLLEFKESLNNNLDKHNLEKAKDFFSKAINISQEYVDAYFYLSLVLFYLNDLKNAKKVTLSLLGVSPEHEAGKALLNKINQI